VGEMVEEVFVRVEVVMDLVGGVVGATVEGVDVEKIDDDLIDDLRVEDVVEVVDWCEVDELDEDEIVDDLTVVDVEEAVVTTTEVVDFVVVDVEDDIVEEVRTLDEADVVVTAAEVVEITDDRVVKGMVITLDEDDVYVDVVGVILVDVITAGAELDWELVEIAADEEILVVLMTLEVDVEVVTATVDEVEVDWTVVVGTAGTEDDEDDEDEEVAIEEVEVEDKTELVVAARPSPPIYATRLGLFIVLLPIATGVAELIIFCLIDVGSMKPPFCERYIAAIPAMCGADMLVPLIYAYWLPGTVLGISTPGANKARVGP